MSIYRIARALPFSGLFRQLEKEAETVISVLQPGPLGIIEHKFTPQEIRQAKATVFTAVENWRRHSKLDHANGVLNDFIYKCPSFQATVDSPHKFQAQKIVSEILFCLYDLESIEQMSV